MAGRRVCEGGGSRCFVRFVSMNQTTRWHLLEDSNLHRHRHDLQDL